MISPTILNSFISRSFEFKRKKEKERKEKERKRGILKLGFAINGSLGENFSRKKLPLY